MCAILPVLESNVFVIALEHYNSRNYRKSIFLSIFFNFCKHAVIKEVSFHLYSFTLESKVMHDTISESCTCAYEYAMWGNIEDQFHPDQYSLICGGGLLYSAMQTFRPDKLLHQHFRPVDSAFSNISRSHDSFGTSSLSCLGEFPWISSDKTSIMYPQYDNFLATGSLHRTDYIINRFY